ncbi:MAG TPA: histidine--tRNA ligase [Syntrophorhabdaceae bacterium]|nr:histidine--tRNA ligase [Syntrophorhabdaceae bacterium]HQM81183.1 histidine--tRNA ligase [Syntrophorhabdaceae bacterium]
MEKIRTLRGFRDIVGEDIERFGRIEDASRRYLDLLGFAEIATPVLESTDLFVRSIGDATDIVEKEMFTFTDLGGDSLTLRPEATAGVVRAYLQAGMYAKERISKIFTMGPMFRHERPQKGRFRQFYQVDVEVFGSDDPFIDAELLWMISLLLADLGVKKYTMEVNSVGCKLCREEFRTVLVSYFETKKDRLCEDCLRRLYKNPLRIFDCKNAQCIEVNSESPLLFDYLCTECGSHFNSFLSHMNGFGVPVTVNKRLVRGLDYYTKTVFEVTSDELGAQKAFTAGGRYDNLVEEMGGPKTPAIGFAIGMERLALIVGSGERPRKPVFFFAYLGEKAKAYLVPVTKAFIAQGLPIRYSYDGKSLKSQMRYADSLGADFVMILGDDEINRCIIVARNMKDKKQFELPLDPSEIAVELKRRIQK